MRVCVCVCVEMQSCFPSLTPRLTVGDGFFFFLKLYTALIFIYYDLWRISAAAKNKVNTQTNQSNLKKITGTPLCLFLTPLLNGQCRPAPLPPSLYPSIFPFSVPFSLAVSKMAYCTAVLLTAAYV